MRVASLAIDATLVWAIWQSRVRIRLLDSTDEFIGYYENNHVPLILSLAPSPAVYKRRYVAHDEKLTQGSDGVDFDVMTELGFADRQPFLAWMGALSGPGVGEQVAIDEAKFLDRSRTRAYVVDERVTTP